MATASTGNDVRRSGDHVLEEIPSVPDVVEKRLFQLFEGDIYNFHS